MTNVQLILVFGAGALVLFSFVYFFFDRARKSAMANGKETHGSRPFSITFARLFGLITIGILGVGLSFSTDKDSLAASGFTLLGTIAGYLAGAKATSTRSAVRRDEPPGNQSETVAIPDEQL